MPFAFMARKEPVAGLANRARQAWFQLQVRTWRLWRKLVLTWRKSTSPVPQRVVSRFRKHSNLADVGTWEVT
jgi:hypothetical protein